MLCCNRFIRSSFFFPQILFFPLLSFSFPLLTSPLLSSPLLSSPLPTLSLLSFSLLRSSKYLYRSAAPPALPPVSQDWWPSSTGCGWQQGTFIGLYKSTDTMFYSVSHTFALLLSKH